MNNVNSLPSVREVSIVVRVQILTDLNRVSVLDLDNTFVSAGIHIEKRGSTRLYAFCTKQNQTELSTILGVNKQCCYCISLYDVNYGELPKEFTEAM